MSGSAKKVVDLLRGFESQGLTRGMEQERDLWALLRRAMRRSHGPTLFHVLHEYDSEYLLSDLFQSPQGQEFHRALKSLDAETVAKRAFSETIMNRLAKSRWEKRKIDIGLKTGDSEKVPAYVLGVWAVHKELGGSGWSVTHAPSGLLAYSTRSNPRGAKTMAVCKAFVMALLKQKPGLAKVRDAEQLMSQKEIFMGLMRNPSGWMPVAKGKGKKKAPRKSVGERRLEIVGLLRQFGLESLGTRYGKSGEFFGISGSSRVLSVGRSYVMQNVLLVQQQQGRNKMETRWNMYADHRISTLTDQELKSLADWAKSGRTSVELRAIVRKQVAETGSGSTDGSISKPPEAEEVSEGKLARRILARWLQGKRRRVDPAVSRRMKKLQQRARRNRGRAKKKKPITRDDNGNLVLDVSPFMFERHRDGGEKPYTHRGRRIKVKSLKKVNYKAWRRKYQQWADGFKRQFQKKKQKEQAAQEKKRQMEQKRQLSQGAP